MKSFIGKRSVILDGHKTNVSIEDIFWNGLKQIAATDKIKLSSLVGMIDAQRAPGTNLSSAIRVFILARFRDQARALGGSAAAPPQ